MTTVTFKDYMKTLFPEFTYRLGRVDQSLEKSITLYPRSGTKGMFFFEHESPVQNLPLTLTITYTNNFTLAESKTSDIYQQLIKINNETFNKYHFTVIPFNDRLPVYLGISENGYYQFAIDIDIINN